MNPAHDLLFKLFEASRPLKTALALKNDQLRLGTQSHGTRQTSSIERSNATLNCLEFEGASCVSTQHSALSTQRVKSERNFAKLIFFALLSSFAITFAASAQNNLDTQREYVAGPTCYLNNDEVFKDIGSACKRVRDNIKSQVNGSPPHYQKAIDPISQPSEEERPASFSCYWSVTDYFGNVIFERAACGGMVRPVQSLLLSLTPAPDQKDPQPLKAEGVDGKSTLDLIAKVTGNGSPKAGLEVSFQVDVVSMTGGHEHHDGARPKGALSKVNGTTDANGEVQVTFKAPEIAGIHTIKATCAICSNSLATKETQVKVPNLLPISPNPPRNTDGTFVYGLTSVDKTHQGNGRYHHNQYYLTEQSRQNLLDMVRAFAAEGWGTVALNDASLYWGGRYDISANWAGSHKGHLDGREIDISFARAGNPISPSKQKVFYDKFCKSKKVSFPFSILHHYVENPHFHVYLEKQTACWTSEK